MTTRKIVLEKVKELIQNEHSEKSLLTETQKILDAGYFTLSEFEDNYKLPKMLMFLALRKIGWGFRPLSNKDQIIVDEIEKVI